RRRRLADAALRRRYRRSRAAAADRGHARGRSLRARAGIGPVGAAVQSHDRRRRHRRARARAPRRRPELSVAELIDAAIAGRLPATELVRRLDALAAEDGAAAQHARAILAQRRRDGGVSDADYAELDALLASHFPAPDDDGTRLKPRSPRGTGAGSTGASQADASASDTGTRVVRRT